MSMKLRALLLDNYRAKVEQAYMHAGEAITLKNVPCEMTFEVSSGWMEHESEKHHYLPLFHLIGNIKEISGNFPYNVSSLTFSKADIETKLQKEILYFMKPEELAHLITVGKFYTNKFQLPEILTRNTYSFPVMVDLTIVPPPNPAAYEQASFSIGLDGDVGQIDRDNLPIFYIGFAGTGVNRKKDALLDYYGIEFDEDFPVYALTAESSGYTNPTLMEYVTEPEEEVQAEPEATEELYVTPEEEAAMLKQQKEQTQEDVRQLNPQDDYQMDAEDVLLAQADKNIEQRIAKVLSHERAKAKQREAVQPNKQVSTPDRTKASTLERLANLEKMMKSGDSKSNLMKKSEQKPVYEVKEEPVQPVGKPLSEQNSVKPVREEFVQSQDVTESAKLEQPDTLQQQAEVKMDFNPEVNTLLHPENDQRNKENSEELGVLDVEEDDMTTLKDANGADVSDARLQAKVDEANVRENARQVAVDIHADMAEVSDGSEKKHRDVSDKLNDVAEAAESMNGYDETLGVSY